MRQLANSYAGTVEFLNSACGVVELKVKGPQRGFAGTRAFGHKARLEHKQTNLSCSAGRGELKKGDLVPTRYEIGGFRSKRFRSHLQMEGKP